MLKYVQFLYEIYEKEKDKSKKFDSLRTIIRAEARLNNDIITVILNSDPKVVAQKCPNLFEQLETNSIDLLSALGLPSFQVFDDEKDPTEEDFNNLDKSNNTEEYFKCRPQSELYEFYIRKSKLLNCLARSNSIVEVNIKLTKRLQNIAFATRFLIKRLK